MRRSWLLVVLSLSLTAVPALGQEGEGEAPVTVEEEGVHGRSAFKSPGGLLDRSTHKRDMELIFQLGLPYGYYFGGFGLGLAARFYYPIVPDGFISSINDEFGLEGGVDVMFYFSYLSTYSPVRLDIPVAARWSFHLTDAWTVFAKLGLGIGIWPGAYYSVWFVGEGGVGAIYKLSDVISLRLDVGYPWAKFGVVIAL